MSSSPNLRTTTAELAWSDSGQPRSLRFDDIYYSAGAELAESEFVFLQGSKLAARWQEQPHTERAFTIAELGFGAGLNFLQTCELWRDLKLRHPHWKRLHYIGFEHYPLSDQDLLNIHTNWPQLADLAQRLRNQYDSDSSGWHRLHIDKDICLDLVFGDAGEELGMRSLHEQKIDAWLLDGFSPKVNPALWDPKIYQLIAMHSHSSSTVATYSSAGSVRRGLQDAGFKVSKQAGFANKRHMLTATALEPDSTPPPTNASNPWFVYPASAPQPKHAIVIGAGLAGAWCAHALSQRDWQVTVIDGAKEIAAGASGIPQLALRCRLFNQADTSARFFLQAYRYAVRQLRSLSSADQICWHETGVLQLENAMNKRRSLRLENIAEIYAESVVRMANEEETIGHSSTRIDDSALFYPNGGWVDGRQLCTGLLQADNIHIQLQQEAEQLVFESGNWQVLGKSQQLLGAAPVVILALGSSLNHLRQAQALPLELSVGQSTSVGSTPELSTLRTVLSGERSIFPARNGCHTISASYRREANSLHAEPSEHTANLNALSNMLGLTEQALGPITGAGVAVRANTRDRLPMVGMVPNQQLMHSHYAELARNAKTEFKQTGAYHSGLYISAGHGSNGMSTAPLSAEYLAALINRDCLPLDREIMDALNPARFLIQDLKKQRSKQN